MTSTAPTHPSLVWPRTDGDSSRWPELQSTNGTRMEPLPETHKKYASYEETAGEHLAEILGLPKLPGTQTVHLPRAGLERRLTGV
jgi:hypothetical protein